MTIVAYPLDAVSGAPSYTGEMVRQALSTLAGYAPPGRPLGVTSGVRGGTPTNTVAATSTTATLGVHAGCLDLETSATAGPYCYAVTVAETKPMTAASSTNDRIDVLYMQINDPAESDGSTTPGVTWGLVTGTPASTPAPPSAPNSRDIILAQIYVPKSGTGSPSVTWVAPTTTASGTAVAYSNGSTASGQVFASGPFGLVNTWSLTSKNITYSAGTWTLTAAGVYAVDASIAFAPGGTGIRVAQIQVNGTAVAENVIRGDAGFALPQGLSWGGVLSVGDTITVNGSQNNGTSLALSVFGKQNYVSIRRTGDA